MTRDPRWEKLECARPSLLAAFAGEGVLRIEYIAAWPDLDGLGVWLCTASNAARDALGPENPRKAEVETILREYGLDDRDLRTGLLATRAQSQQTVDRDYEGSWFYALR
jgi:hypothetical protein